MTMNLNQHLSKTASTKAEHYNLQTKTAVLDLESN